MPLGLGLGIGNRRACVGGSVPGQVTNLVATPGSVTVGLAWTAVNGATSYQVFRGTATGAEIYLATVLSGHVYTDNAVVVGTHYYYKVKAVNASGPGTPSAEANAIPIA